MSGEPIVANKAASRCACHRSPKICAYCRTGCLDELLLASEPDELCLISRKNRCARLTCSFFFRISNEPIPWPAMEEQSSRPGPEQTGFRVGHLRTRLCDPAYLHAFARVFAQRFVATYYWLHQKQRSTGAALSYLCRTSRE